MCRLRRRDISGTCRCLLRTLCAGEFRRLRAAGRRPTPFLLFPFEREETGGTVAPAASRFPLVAASGALPRNSLASSATGGASLISTAEKVTKKPPKPAVLESLFVGAFYEAKGGVPRSVRCLSSAVLTVQCAACPAARHFLMLKCLPRTWARETHEAECHPPPAGRSLEQCS